MKTWRRTRGNKYCGSLVSAVLIGLMSITSYALAEDEDYYLAQESLKYNDKEFAELLFLAKDNGIGTTGQWLVNPAKYDLSDELIAATADSSMYWVGILGDDAKNKAPWQIFVGTDFDSNAYAGSTNIVSNGVRKAYYSYRPAESFVRNQIKYGDELEKLTPESAETGVLPAGKYGFSEITVGKNMGANREEAVDGWWVDTDTVLPTNEQAVDYVGTIRHELGHALGITAIKRTNNGRTYFHPNLTDETSWSLHLQDQNGNPSEAGMRILTSEEFAKIQAANPDISASRYFIVDKEVTADGKGFAYFSGEHVVEALDGAKFYGRNAIPVNGWGSRGFDGGHIQTAGMMSHRDYTNYTTFLEVELAALQDLGYKLDRRELYGRSIYVNGGIINNTQGFFARNEEGTAYINGSYSEIPLGIGLHIYGYGNQVTQSANILTRGTGGTGIRVDGMTNTLIIPKDTEIHAEGKRGNGVLIAYGRNQTVEQAGTVTAKGNGGIGMRFDFGSSTNGAAEEYRGSYIRYNREVNGYSSKAEPGTISSAENLKLTSINPKHYSASNDELEGPLVDNYNLSGQLAGEDAAIYIGKSAFVKNININNGAVIQGEIVSDWKQFGTDECEGSYDGDGEDLDVLRIQYKNNYEKKGYEYSTYIPDLVTNLNFNTSSMSYDGNINGEDNMKLNVTDGILNYSGEANVVNVTVAKGAQLYGGSYRVNDMSERMAAGYTDETTGKFINHGTIGAENGDTEMYIEGNLVSDGYLQAYDDGTKGQILVDGDADIEGSTVLAKASLPGEQHVFMEATGSISGSVTNGKDNPYAYSAMLNTYGEVKDKELIVHSAAGNNMGPLTEDQIRAFTAMNNMAQSLTEAGDSRVNNMRLLYAMDRGEAKAALTALGSSPVANNMVMTQRNTMTSHILSARLTEAFAKQAVNVPIPVAQLDGQSPDKTATITMNLDQPVDNDFWFKVARNWGDGTGSSYYQGTTIGGGWDRAYGRSWRAGVFVSYGTFSFADNLSHDDVKDTRLGLYGG
uniref:autotransporter outer membrane beta-barrel domain-containing protein n=1 Tax=uncultured Anaerovibrio sp. TaxID=361586 RepID=UPI00260B4B9F